ncbi:hypothetical protein GCM10011360_17480 [Primorskyibacter flagellatus]|uniref:Uncharacterized protein n=2 Tax=Primorskyibacter flagellatus TaxID=1387277 RepID=A0A917A5X6_9RHOB|nr:hypothetical protein GCM10011360_17480 [Primorskyibacter flagellatus]
MLGIMNAALLAQGQLEIVAENDGSMEYRTLFRNWPGIVESELEDGAYYFTRVEQNLVTRAPGKFGYDDAYLTPSAAIHVRRCWLRNSQGHDINVDWIQDGTHVHLNNPDGCWIEYVEVGAQNLWSANFCMGVQKRCEAIIARAVREEYREAEGLDQAAEVYFQRARTNSSKARSAQPFYRKGPIASARHRRG